MLREGNKTGIVGRPKDINERTILATQCVSQYKFTIPMVIDGMDGKVNEIYQAAPVRVTIVDIDGKVAFYAGRGPGDFRIPPVERTLRKLTAGKGRLAPAPPYQWSETVEGLRCGLSFDPAKLSVGEDIVARLAFQNTTSQPLALRFDQTAAAQDLIIRNDDGQSLRIAVAQDARRARGRDNNPIRRIEPGQTFESEIEGTLASADGQAITAGQFHGQLVREMSDTPRGEARIGEAESVWTGKIASAPCTLDVTLPRQPGCVDCHGGGDYHHAQSNNCDRCHVGKMGEAGFGLRADACSACHPREGLRGHRQILGAGGEFDQASRHLSGTIADADCLLCHDQNSHGDGVVGLIDPDSGGTRPWTGGRAAFCLTCHDGHPPQSVSFPEGSKGSGFDKTEFMVSAFAMSDQGCNLCHNPHGSLYPSLLKNVHGR